MDVDDKVGNLCLSLPRRAHALQPWESASWMARSAAWPWELSVTQPPAVDPVPVVHSSTLVLKREAEKSSAPAVPDYDGGFALAVCSRSTVYEGDRRSSAVFKLTALVKGRPDAFYIVAQCADSQGRVDLDELDFSIKAALSYKATNTWVRRLNSLSAFVQWASTQSPLATPFPVTEKVKWRCIQWMTRNGKGASSPSSLLQSLNWYSGVCGLAFESEVTSSRFIGLCRSTEASAPTMSSLVDSVAEFKSRAQQLLGEEDARKLLTNDIKSFGELAYSVADQPDRI
ncbi:unnamed protein product, partial [Symbiodinium sp. CCMP2456]